MNESDKKKDVMDKTKQAMNDTKAWRMVLVWKNSINCFKKKRRKDNSSSGRRTCKERRGMWRSGTRCSTSGVSGAAREILEQISMVMQQPQQQQQKQQMQDKTRSSNTGSNPRQAWGQSEGSGWRHSQQQKRQQWSSVWQQCSKHTRKMRTTETTKRS